MCSEIWEYPPCLSWDRLFHNTQRARPRLHLPSHRQTANEEKANFYSDFVAGNISLKLSHLDYSPELQKHAGSLIKHMQLRITWSAVNTWWLVNRYQRLFPCSELSVMYRTDMHPHFIHVEKCCNQFHAWKSEYSFSFYQNMIIRDLHHLVLI